MLLEKGVLHQEDRTREAVFVAIDPVTTMPTMPSQAITANDEATIDAIRPDLGFKEHKGEDNRYRADTYNRITMANSRVSTGQMNPQTMASIEDAGNAMQDVEQLLERLGGSVMEMTETYPSNPEDESDLRQGLTKIENVLAAAVERFSFSRLQLNTAMPVDPDQIRKCEQLNRQLGVQLENLKILRKRIADRLAEPQKVGE